MNEFTAKKAGEVLAFTQAGLQILQKADGLGSVLGDSTISAMKEQLKAFESELLEVFDTEHLALVKTKGESTVMKLDDLADRYIGDQWDNPVEVLEWLGFFEGAAVVHCAVIEGASTSLALGELLPLATRMKQFHHEALNGVEAALFQAGSDRATS